MITLIEPSLYIFNPAINKPDRITSLFTYAATAEVLIYSHKTLAAVPSSERIVLAAVGGLFLCRVITLPLLKGEMGLSPNSKKEWCYLLRIISSTALLILSPNYLCLTLLVTTTYSLYLSRSAP